MTGIKLATSNVFGVDHVIPQLKLSLVVVCVLHGLELNYYDVKFGSHKHKAQALDYADLIGISNATILLSVHAGDAILYWFQI